MELTKGAYSVAEAAELIQRTDQTVYALARTLDPATGTTRLERIKPEGETIRTVLITRESLGREMKRRGLL